MAVGTLYKDMKLKPTVLKEYTENRTMAAQLGADTFTEASDGLILEDESARIKLTGNLDVGVLVTGIIVAVRGVYDAKLGSLHVTDHTFAGVPLLNTGMHAAFEAHTVAQLHAQHDCTTVQINQVDHSQSCSQDSLLLLQACRCSLHAHHPRVRNG